MSQTFLTFGDIAGKLHMLQIECTRCARKGSYSVAKLLVEHGHRANTATWGDGIGAACLVVNKTGVQRATKFPKRPQFIHASMPSEDRQ